MAKCPRRDGGLDAGRIGVPRSGESGGRTIGYRGAGKAAVKRLTVILAVLAATLVAVQPAAADSRTIRDARNDFKGSDWPGPGFVWASAGPCAGAWVKVETNTCENQEYVEYEGLRLDIASVSHGHAGRLVEHRIAMHRNWANSLLSRGNGGQISFYLSTNRDAAFERRLDLVVARGKLKGVLRSRAGRVVGRVGATRPNAKTARVAFPRKLIGPRVRSYRWFAFAGVHCKRKYDLCGDRSPGSALVQHRL